MDNGSVPTKSINAWKAHLNWTTTFFEFGPFFLIIKN
ncbi:hypothetical protein Patl1_34669 [Pistacia atlantica]|uniref:Uncharacterized protein n=1 Tax=Pistacia atlantica TaxID=434234 RepID=A0ACC0ZTA4_9ROSI|nr:hypothetical protein Patl1_34669 [Pistacia atlantica]